MDWADMTTYLGVIMQSNLKCDQHVALKKDKASKNLGAIKHTNKPHKKDGYWLTPACAAQYWSTLTLWNPTIAKEIESLWMLQDGAVRFIVKLRGQESVTEACSELGPQPLKQRRRNHRLSCLMKI